MPAEFGGLGLILSRPRAPGPARGRRARHRARREHAPGLDRRRQDPARPRRRLAGVRAPGGGRRRGVRLRAERGRQRPRAVRLDDRGPAEARRLVPYIGTKIFTSLSPAWTRLGTFGLDTTSPDAPKIVYGFVDRAAAASRSREDWDTLGMRATQSNTTVLDGALAPPTAWCAASRPAPTPTRSSSRSSRTSRCCSPPSTPASAHRARRAGGRVRAPPDEPEERRPPLRERPGHPLARRRPPRSTRTRSFPSSMRSPATSTRSPTTARSGSRSWWG